MKATSPPPNDDEIRALAARLGELALARQIMLATAESCTGGLVAGAITDIAGSSDVFDRGFVTYSNAAKTQMLGVDPALIETHGAVSEEVAAAMAAGALARSEATCAVAAIRRSTDEHRIAHETRLANTSVSHHCAVVTHDGRPVASGQLAYEGDIAGLFDIVTAEEMRGRGYATALCAQLLNWAWNHGMRIVYLQVTADNAPALAVYRKFGFESCYTYHYRCRPQEFA